MPRYMLLHYGFTQPTPELMQAWGAWSDTLAGRQDEQGGFAAGVEISTSGESALGRDADSITGYNIIEADSLDEAVRIAHGNPFISAIRVYELR